MVGWLVGLLLGSLVGWLVSWFVDWFVGLLVCEFVGEFVGLTLNILKGANRGCMCVECVRQKCFISCAHTTVFRWVNVIVTSDVGVCCDPSCPWSKQTVPSS